MGRTKSLTGDSVNTEAYVNKVQSKSDSKVILFYYPSMRSFLLHSEILSQHPNLFDCVIEMPAVPYSRSKGKRNIKKIIKTLFDCPRFFVMSFITIKVYSLLSGLFKTSIKDICETNNIEHYSYKKIDVDLISFMSSRKPIWIISSTSALLTKEFLKVPSLGVINFHEAPLPKYRGSASYFWFIVNDEKYVNTTVHYVVEKLDAGPIIFEGPKVPVSQPTVFSLWLEMLLSYKTSWEYILPYLIDGRRIPSIPQSTSNFKEYSYPDRTSINAFGKKIVFFNFENIKCVFNVAMQGMKKIKRL